MNTRIRSFAECGILESKYGAATSAIISVYPIGTSIRIVSRNFIL